MHRDHAHKRTALACNEVAVLVVKAVNESAIRSPRVLPNLFCEHPMVQAMNLFDLIRSFGFFELHSGHRSYPQFE
jgi:hypothetical protein